MDQYLHLGSRAEMPCPVPINAVLVHQAGGISSVVFVHANAMAHLVKNGVQLDLFSSIFTRILQTYIKRFRIVNNWIFHHSIGIRIKQREAYNGRAGEVLIVRCYVDSGTRSRRERYFSSFIVNGVGMTTARDKMVIDYTLQPLLERATIFRDSKDTNELLCEQFNISKKLGWNVTRARQLIQQEENLEQYIKPVLYRPFDARLIFYHDSLVWRTVKQIMHHMLDGENLGLISARSNKSSEMNHFFCSRFIMETKCGESTTQSCLFPIYLYPAKGEMQFDKGRRPNLNPEFTKSVSNKLGLQFIEDGRGNLDKTFGPEDIFNYAYAVFHSPTYRTRYAEFLKIDFPKLPLTSDKRLFKALAEKGAELVALHLMESPAQNTHVTRYPVTGSNEAGKITYDEKTQRVYINREQYFEGVPPEVWEFHIGGYQVCQKWLKDRKGRTLTYDERIHYQKIVVALKETIRIMAEIDGVIPEWPME